MFQNASVCAWYFIQVFLIILKLSQACTFDLQILGVFHIPIQMNILNRQNHSPRSRAFISCLILHTIHHLYSRGSIISSRYDYTIYAPGIRLGLCDTLQNVDLVLPDPRSQRRRGRRSARTLRQLVYYYALVSNRIELYPSTNDRQWPSSADPAADIHTSLSEYRGTV